MMMDGADVWAANGSLFMYEILLPLLSQFRLDYSKKFIYMTYSWG
jgi:hypothetical protein